VTDHSLPTHSAGPPALFAPWRLQYLEALDKSEKAIGGPPVVGSGSFLLDAWNHPELDEAAHVVVRTQDGLILLNAYPYSNGHLLVALGDPRPTLLDYEPAQRDALWQLVELAADLLHRALEPQGVNIGLNQGRAAGAGVPQHMHVHLVPRWVGDTNFMEVVGRVCVIPASLEAMAERYRAAWEKLKAERPGSLRPPSGA
jgi:ATP adenylyltransferase